MIRVLWLLVFLLVVAGVLLLFVSITAPAMAQASVGAMVGAFVVCCYVGMRAIEAMVAPLPRRDSED
jgi:hypothetical protein